MLDMHPIFEFFFSIFPVKIVTRHTSHVTRHTSPCALLILTAANCKTADHIVQLQLQREWRRNRGSAQMVVAGPMLSKRVTVLCVCCCGLPLKF